MKKLAVVLVLVGIFTSCVGSAAVAQRFPVHLCVTVIAADVNVHVIADYLGEVGGIFVFDLNGWMEQPGDTIKPVYGTATIISGVITKIKWVIARHSVVGIYSPMVMDFETSLLLEGSGKVQSLITPEASFGFTITPGPCPE